MKQHEPHCPVPRAEARGEGAACLCGSDRLRGLSVREWKPGSRVMDRHGFCALLIAPVWAQFAWIVYDGKANPVTVNAFDLVLAREPAEPHPSCY
jgi:hypothetical protein